MAHHDFRHAVSASRPRPYAALVIAHGSDPAARTNAHYREGAAHWLRAGVAVLLADKRGVGDSGGEYVEAPDLRVPAGDVLAAVDYLRRRPDINPSAVGVLGGSQGGSQGGWVAMLAARSGAVAFVVTLSGPGVSVLDQVVYIRGQEMLVSGFSAEEVEAASRYRRRLYDYYGTGSGRGTMHQLLDSARAEPWFSRAEFRNALPAEADLQSSRFDFYRNLQFDPDTVLDELRIPVLAVFGGMDRNVPVDASVTRMRAAFIRAGNRDATIVVFPRAGHGLSIVPEHDAVGPQEHGALEPAPGYVDLGSPVAAATGPERPVNVTCAGPLRRDPASFRTRQADRAAAHFGIMERQGNSRSDTARRRPAASSSTAVANSIRSGARSARSTAYATG